MDAIVRRLREYVRVYALPKRGESVLAACSGGADSIALLLVLHELRDALGIRLACAHYEHGFRGEESLSDMRFTAECAARLGIPFHSEHGNLGALLQEEGGNAQELARSRRYAFLERVRRAEGYDRVALAHTADDQAGTVLYKFLRGSSISALAGMPASRESVIRPLLFARRREIEEYLRARGQSWREDSSNEDLSYRRNLLRRIILPELEKHFPALPRHLGELAHEAGDLVRDLDALAHARGLAAREETGGVSWPLQALQAAPPALARHVLSQRLAEQVHRASDLPGRAWYCAYEKRLARRDGEGGLLYHGAAGTVYIHRGRVYCLLPRAESFYQILTEEYVLAEGDFSFPWGKLRIRSSELPAGAGKKFFKEQVLRGIFWLNAAALRERIVMRAARSGERVRLAGGLSKKAADLLAEAGVPLPLRRTALVFAFEKGSAVALFVPAMLMYGRVGSALHVQEESPALRLSFVLSEARLSGMSGAELEDG